MSEPRTIPVQPEGASLVTLIIKIEGEPIPRSYNVMSVVVNRQVNKIPRLHLMLHDGDAASADFAVSNEPQFVPGKKIEVMGGFSNQEQSLFSGIILRHSIRIRATGSPMLIIEAADEAVKMTASPKRKYFTDIKDSDLIEELASTYGLDCEVESSSVVHKQLVQYYATDWDYIQIRAEANGKLCFCEDGKLVVKAPDMTGRPVVEVTYGATIIELDAEMDAFTQFSGVKTVSWDPAEQELLDLEAKDSNGTDQGNLSSEALSGVLHQQPFTLLHGGAVTEQELQEWADVQLLKSRLAKIRGKVRLTGFPGVKPGLMLGLGGIGQRFNGTAFISGVRHEFQNGNWFTDVQFGLSPEWFAKENDVQPLPAAGLSPGVKGLQTGVVTDLEDPLGEFRVKVRIPVVDNTHEGTWCRMMAPEAGKERGTYFRPEIGDEVIVGFLHEDPNHGIVLGAMFSSARPSTFQPSNDNHEKGWVTRSGMKWIWNDEKKSMLLETPAGNRMMVSDDERQLELSDEHGNKITMNAEGITLEAGKAITLKAGTDIKGEAGTGLELKGGTTANIEGSASAELSSGGNTTVKGSIVMIN